MKINSIEFPRFRNDEHFQFGTEFRDLVNRFGAQALKCEARFNLFLDSYAKEDEALKKIRKSAITDDIREADSRRDRIFSGLASANKTALKHFMPDVQQAAKRLKVLFDTYGNLAKKPLNEQTSGVYNLLQDLRGDVYAGDAATAGLTAWIKELETANAAFDNLVKGRYEEAFNRTDLVLREVRLELDERYRSIIALITALVEIEGETDYADFIRVLNLIIDKYNNILAARIGRNKVGKDDEEIES
jgi:hypothetical protein